MAARKSTRKTASHAKALTSCRGNRSRRLRYGTAARASRSRHAQSDGIDPAEGPPRNREDLLTRLSTSLALVETASIALKSYEEEPTLGSICLALEKAASCVQRAHA